MVVIVKKGSEEWNKIFILTNKWVFLYLFVSERKLLIFIIHLYD
jgi:hypothetical protein